MASITRIKTTGNWRALVRLKELGRALCATFGTKAEAKAWAAMQEGRAHGGDDPSAGKDVTVSQAIASLRKKREKGNPVARGSGLDCRLKNLDAALGTRTVAKLSFGSILDYCEGRLFPEDGEGVAKSTVYGEVKTLGTVLSGVNRAVRERLLNREAMLELRRNHRLIAPANERDRRVEGDELERILEYLPKTYHEASRFAIVSAMRRGEITALRRSRLSVVNETIKVMRKHPEGSREHVVPLLRGEVLKRKGLTAGAWEIIQRQPERAGDDRIFPVNGNEWSRAWRKACKKAGVADLHLHDLRHEAISRLFEAGYDIPEVAAISGHRTWSQLKRYVKLRPEALKHGPAKVLALKVAA